MINNDKQRYEEFCLREGTIPIYSKPWWMDAVCGPENWGVYLVGNGNDIQASFVFYQIEENGKKRIKKALLTQNNGIHIHYPEGQGIISKQKYEERIMDEILDFIESLGLAGYEQQHHWRLTNWMPFFWRYYKESVKYTYLIDDVSDMDSVRDGYSSNARKLIKKAKKYVKPVEMEDPVEFYYVNELSFSRQGVEIPYSYEEFYRIYKACSDHDCVKMLGVKDDIGRIHAVAMIVWDESYVYFLLNGTDPELKEYQGNFLLIDTCIEEAHRLNRAFDFEGSVIRPVNHAFRQFGGIPTPYFRISKDY